MTELTVHDSIKQAVITRLATVNQALHFIAITKAKPAKVTVEEILDLAERIEHWAWRDLLGEQRTDARAPEKLADLALSVPPAKAEPEPAAGKKDERPRPNGQGQRPGEASEKQINAIFAIGKSKGYSAEDLKALVKEKLSKSLSQLTGREASRLIDDLRAL